jgi:magnesium transporter
MTSNPTVEAAAHASQPVNCVAYEDGRKVGDIAMADIPGYLARANCFVWAALHDPPAALVLEFQRLFVLHPLAVEDAANPSQRPKIEEYGDALFAVVKLIEPATDDFNVGELAVFLGRNYVLSIRSLANKGFQDVRERCEREPDMLRQGPGYILYALIDAVVDRYFPLLDALEDDLDVIEQRIFTPGGTPQENIEAVYELKQRLMVVKHAVSPLLEGVSNLSGARVPVLCAGLNVYFRDIYDHLQRLNQTADSLRDTVATAMSVNLSMVTLQESETMKQLAAYAALLAVPTMIAGIYGMNFEHMPELKWHFGYPVSLVVMGLIDVYLYWRFKKANWL